MARRFVIMSACLWGLGVSALAGRATAAAPPGDEGPEDPIFVVMDLPLVAQQVRLAGVANLEVQVAIDASVEAGLAASEIHGLLAAEADAAQGERGPKQGFGQWVRQQVAAGLHGPALAAEIHQRLDATEELSEAEKNQLQAKLRAQKPKHEGRHKARKEQLVAALKAGKKPHFRGREEHLARKQALAQARDTLRARYLAAKAEGFDQRKRGEAQGKAGEEHGKAGEEHGKAGEEHGKAGEEHGKAGEAQGKAGEEHGKAGEEHGKAGEAHGKAGEAHGKAGEEHGKAGEEHGKAGEKPGKAGEKPGKAGEEPSKAGGGAGKAGASGGAKPKTPKKAP